MKYLYTAVIAALVGALAGGFTAGLVGGDAPTGGVTRLQHSNIQANLQNTDSDFQIGSQTNDFLLFGDAGNHRVGVSTSSPTNLFHVEDATATSTAVISSGGSAVGGRIILEDHDGAGCSEIAILDGTVAAKTVTCPTGI